MIADIYPVVWTGQQAVVVFPEHVDMSNSAELRGQLLSVINRGATAVIADLSATVSCDHSGTDALARVYQRAAVSGTILQLVVASPVVRRALSTAGTDRLVSVYPSLEAALAARAPTEARALVAVSGTAAPAAPPGPHAGAEVALLDADGVIVSVNAAWLEFAAANDGDPARTGAGMSYLEMCAAADDDPVARAVGTGIRQALAGDLPGPLTVEVPCHSPDTWRWFDLLISARADPGQPPSGAAVTLSVARSRARSPAGVLSPAAAAGQAADLARRLSDDRDRIAASLNDLVVRQLFSAGLSLQAALSLLGDHPAAAKVDDAVLNLDLAITAFRDIVFHQDGREGSS